MEPGNGIVVRDGGCVDTKECQTRPTQKRRCWPVGNACDPWSPINHTHATAIGFERLEGTGKLSETRLSTATPQKGL